MSGLNSLEMSSLFRSRGSHDYRETIGPCGDESTGTGCFEGDARSDRGEADAGRGGAVAQTQRSPGASATGEIAGGGRRIVGAWVTWTAVESSTGCGVSPSGAEGVSAELSRLWSDAGVREAG